MESNERIAKYRARMAEEEKTKKGPWGNILPHISKGNVIPMLSSSFRIEQIFSELASSDGDSTVVEQLIAEWANQIGYPMREIHNLAHVAQYLLVEQNDDPNARTNIVDFLKMFLLMLASDDPVYAPLAARLKNQIQELRFSDIVKELDYPRFPSTTEDPLRILARLPLPIYITTSQSNFIERALQAEGKDPCTQICIWWSDVSNVRKEHRVDPDFTPSVTSPLVYHLYGLEDYPQSLVLSEDDYLNFLIRVMGDANNSNPLVPLNVRRALTESHLLLIGYRLSAWDFRVLFRFILKFRQSGISPRGMLIQVKKNDREFSNQKTLSYLSRYFDKNMFDIELTDAEVFIQDLWTKWNEYRQSQL